MTSAEIETKLLQEIPIEDILSNIESQLNTNAIDFSFALELARASGVATENLRQLNGLSEQTRDGQLSRRAALFAAFNLGIKSAGGAV